VELPVLRRRASCTSWPARRRICCTFDRGAFACMLGGEDRTTLFILAASWSEEDMAEASPT